MTVCWLVQLRTKNAGIVDFGWVLCLMTTAVIYAFSSPAAAVGYLVFLLMVLTWGERLSLLLLGRLRKGEEEDPRYQDIRRSWKTNVNLKFLLFFEFQALLAVLLSLPFWFVSRDPRPGLSFFQIAGFAVWLAGFLGEAVADRQLKRFKKDPSSKGKPCRSGLWKYSRHPNYFFEWVVWIGYFIYALGSPDGWISIICPILMLHFLVNVSGIPPAEAQALKSKGDAYREYQRQVSPFIPWFPKP